MITVNWKGGMAFQGMNPEGKSILIDATEDHGGQGLGPTPLEALLMSVASCSGMDVVSILEKKRMKITSYDIQVIAERNTEGDWPHPFTSIEINHHVSGPDVTQEALDHAVELSDEKYCSAIATLRFSPKVTSLGLLS